MNINKKLISELFLKIKKLKKIGTMNLVLIVLGVAVTLFTISTLYIYYKMQVAPDTLVERFFTCIVGEGGFLCIIKVVKTVFCAKNNSSDDSNEDNLIEEDDR